MAVVLTESGLFCQVQRQQSSQVKHFAFMRQLQLAQAVAVFQFTLENGAVMPHGCHVFWCVRVWAENKFCAASFLWGGFVVQWDAFLAQVIAGEQHIAFAWCAQIQALRILAPP